LIAAAKRGNARAFEALIARHQQRVLAIALRRTRVRQDAEDIVQQSFQKVFLHLHQFEGRSSFSTWLTRVAINEAQMLYRKSGNTREVSIDDLNENAVTVLRWRSQIQLRILKLLTQSESGDECCPLL
jgi:RNA polymerase sigma-70 factor (ECF subfamily)